MTTIYEKNHLFYSLLRTTCKLAGTADDGDGVFVDQALHVGHVNGLTVIGAAEG